jgi:hypothetical protein
MKWITCLSIAFALAGSVMVRGDDARVSAIAPFLNSDTIALVRLDLVKADAEKLARRLVDDKAQADEMSRNIAPWFKALRDAGAKEIFVLISLPDVMGGPMTAPPPVVVPVGEKANSKAIGLVLCGGDAPTGQLVWPTCLSIHGAVFAGSHEAAARVQQLKAVQRPELAEALAALGDTSVEAVLIPSADTRRVVEETLPGLPTELGGGPMTAITQGFHWLAAGLSTDPEPSLRLIVQARDADSARALHSLGERLMKHLGESSRVRRFEPNFGKLTSDLKSEVNQDRIIVRVAPEQARAWARALVLPVREINAKNQCINNLKQIGLAMHNYHSKYKTFPPAYTVDKAGKPLLSWRVLILPYLEQESLFKEFHLDEPWDSPHNRALIERMPMMYRCPDSSGKAAAKGMTTYLVPRGKSTIFPGAEGVQLKQVTDGTSNTIFVADAPDDQAVTWTKPDDWEVDAAADLKRIFGHHPEGTIFSFADGSVHFIRDTVDADLLKKLLTRDGGEVIGQDEF